MLYRKYRPKNFSELVGQNHIKSILKNSIIDNKIAHAYIFTGPRGTGKTSTAKIFAKTLNCTNISDGISCEQCENCLNSNYNTDIVEIDAASNNGVDNIREIIENIEIAPMYGKYKVYIIDEVHMLSNQAWNAFLKTLEEPPSNVIFILATTEIQKVPITVLSRCQRFDFQRLTSEDIINNMRDICKLENINHDEESLVMIAKLSDGCMRDALSVLDQLSKMSDTITTDLISSNYGTITDDDLNEIYGFILKSETEKLIELINKIKNRGVDIVNFINILEEFFLEKAIQIKKNNVSNNAFLQLKNIINRLNILQANLNSNSNGYLLLQVELITFINDDNNQISSREIDQIISREIISNNYVEKLNMQKNENSYYLINDNFINVRINNVFTNANKMAKKEFIVVWKEFIEKMSKDLVNDVNKYITKVNVQVVSNNYVLFITDSESIKIICNSKLRELELMFKKTISQDKKFIFITSNEWKKVLDEYNEKIKQDYKYELQDETEFINKNNQDGLAEEIFGDDLITIE